MSLGGEWIRFAQGKTLVGVDEGDVDFNKVEKELGEKTHKLTIDEIPSHIHDSYVNNGWGSKDWGYDFTYSNKAALNGGASGLTGGDQAHNNIQPSITVYFWKRVA